MDSKRGRRVKDIEKQIHDIQSLISEDAINRNEQIIAIDVENFKNVEGEKVVFKVRSVPLDYMKKDAREHEEKRIKRWVTQ